MTIFSKYNMSLFAVEVRLTYAIVVSSTLGPPIRGPTPDTPYPPGCVCLVDGTTVVSGGNDGFIHISDLEGGHSNGSSDMYVLVLFFTSFYFI